MPTQRSKQGLTIVARRFTSCNHGPSWIVLAQEKKQAEFFGGWLKLLSALPELQNLQINVAFVPLVHFMAVHFLLSFKNYSKSFKIIKIHIILHIVLPFGTEHRFRVRTALTLLHVGFISC